MGKHVLIVEDNELAREAWRLLLQASGYRVSVAETVAEALSAARAERPDLALLDLTLPDGESLSIIPQLVVEENPPIFVALTGHDTREVADRCRSAGCAGVLVKPVTSRELLAIVEPLLASRG